MNVDLISFSREFGLMSLGIIAKILMGRGVLSVPKCRVERYCG